MEVKVEAHTRAAIKEEEHDTFDVSEYLFDFVCDVCVDTLSDWCRNGLYWREADKNETENL